MGQTLYLCRGILRKTSLNVIRPFGPHGGSWACISLWNTCKEYTYAWFVSLGEMLLSTAKNRSHTHAIIPSAIIETSLYTDLHELKCLLWDWVCLVSSDSCNIYNVSSFRSQLCLRKWPEPYKVLWNTANLSSAHTHTHKSSPAKGTNIKEWHSSLWWFNLTSRKKIWFNWTPHMEPKIIF